MQLTAQRIGAGMRVDPPHGFDATAGAEGVVQVYIGAGRGASLQCAPAMPGVWLALHGPLQVGLADGTVSLRPRRLLVVEDGSRVQVRARGPAAWMAVLAPKATWRQLFAASGDGRAGSGVLLPATHAAPPALRRLAMALARAALVPAAAADAHALAVDFAHALGDLQSAFDGLIERCPGRSLAQRRSVFARLQRVRRHIEANCHLDLDTPALARRANYSLSHFIRSYRRVFDETPHAALVASRLEHARTLLGSSALAVGEVALASGFENRCAFSRVFKRHFGMTAQDARRSVSA